MEAQIKNPFLGDNPNVTYEQMRNEFTKAIAQIEAGNFDLIYNFED